MDKAYIFDRDGIMDTTFQAFFDEIKEDFPTEFKRCYHYENAEQELLVIPINQKKRFMDCLSNLTSLSKEQQIKVNFLFDTLASFD